MGNLLGNISGHKVYYGGFQGEESDGTNNNHLISLEDLPGKAKAILQGDKQVTPNLRTKKCKYANFNS
ncbi:hypothetical protein H5410_021193 [Solanum commersonii]|uniref:Uncharacterized protein n=1 Tax=Solanum commersonii TaxID=4109 RepID=A0A9J5ZDJ1_SOLCO|nr:hypothetical protein H5410_021193 [Solanum commersonii]